MSQEAKLGSGLFSIISIIKKGSYHSDTTLF